jgi:Cap4 SAVED domain
LDNKWIWEKWLSPTSRQLNYSKFTHVEFAEEQASRPAVVSSLKDVVESHHSQTGDWVRALGSIGFSALSNELRRSLSNLPSQILFYNKKGTEMEVPTRRANLGEVLLAEYVTTKMAYEVPIRRLRYNPNPDQSMKGDDVLGFKFPSAASSRPKLLIGESKFRNEKSPSKVEEAVQKAYEGITSPRKQIPVSLGFVAGILELEKDHSRSQAIRQIRALIESSNNGVERHNLVFLGTLGQPNDPFRWLEDQQNVLPNTTCVNVIFADGIEEWLNKLFEIEL